MICIKYLFPIYSLITVLSTAHAQTRPMAYEDILNKNRITLEDANRYKSIFYVSEYRKKPKDQNTYYWYTSRTITQSQGAYSGKVLHGTFERFYPDKKLAQKGQFKKGLKKGEWKEWSATGTLTKISQWKRSEETGNYRLFNAKGLVSEQGKYVNGQRHGKIQLSDSLSNTPTYQYYQQGKSITREDYIQQNIFRRSSNYLSEKWKTWFSKKPEAAQG